MLLEKKIVVQNKAGLHARPAALFVQVANKFDSDVTILKEDQKINGKSIMGILMLAAERGTELILIIEGEDAEKALRELSEILLTEEEPSI